MCSKCNTLAKVDWGMVAVVLPEANYELLIIHTVKLVLINTVRTYINAIEDRSCSLSLCRMCSHNNTSVPTGDLVMDVHEKVLCESPGFCVLACFD